jgi:citrate lyase beta subunit
MNIAPSSTGFAAIQSLLFVPGSRPDRFAKAMASEADCVCIDLEDAVAPDGKSAARVAALAAVADDPRYAIRINGLRTRDGLQDLLAVAAASVRPAALLLPMVEDAAEIAIAAAVMGSPSIPIVPLIETVRGLDNAAAIASEQTVAMVMFGGADFAAQLGVALAWEPLLMARSRLVLACAAAGRQVIDVPFITLDDQAGLAAECERARALGIAGKAAIHPAQIETIHAVFRPAPAEIEEAEAAAAAWQACQGGVVRFRGKLLEAPMMARYTRILELRDKFHA